MHINQIRDEGQAKHQMYLQNGVKWRKARTPNTKDSVKVTPIKRLSRVWVTMTSLLTTR